MPSPLKIAYDVASLPMATKISDAWLKLKFASLTSKRAASQMVFANGETAPKVTVVVPVYNVERYLALCLQSLRAQNYPNLDVILVNDGSTDGSLAIARKFQEKLNLHIVDQENAGLGAARNTGVQAIDKTDYLMFLDSDDALAPSALQNLLRRIIEVDCDFVIGDTTRMKGLTRLKRRDTRAVFSGQNLAETTLLEHPQAILDVTAWNRLFKFSFYKSNAFKFPQGVYFEDMALMTKAYLRASSFSVLTKTVYLWRVRTEGSKSITQQTSDEVKINDRLKALREMQGLLKAGVVLGKTNQKNLVAFKMRKKNHDLKLYLKTASKTQLMRFDEFLNPGK